MTAAESELWQAAAALTPVAVLRLLADVATDAADDPPLVVVHLTGGQVLDGELLRVGGDRGGEAVAVLADRRSGRLCYALLASVIAVEVRNPRPFQDVLTAGRLPRPRQGGEPVSRLALRREFAPTPDFPVRVDWEAMDGSDLVLGNLARVLEGLRDTAAKVRVDEMGRRTWEELRALYVEHHDGIALSVERTEDGLRVRADLLAALPRNVAAVLYREINTLL